MSPKIIMNPREMIREALTRWPYELDPDDAIIAAAQARWKDGVWQVRLPEHVQEINVNITVHT